MEFGVGWLQDWKRKAERKVGKERHRYLFCAHHNTGQCPFRYLQIVDENGDIWYQRGWWVHCGHDKDKLAELRRHLTPSKRKMAPSDVVTLIGKRRLDLGEDVLDDSEAKRVKEMVSRMKTSMGTDGLAPGTKQDSWGAIGQRIQPCEIWLLNQFLQIISYLLPHSFFSTAHLDVMDEPPNEHTVFIPGLRSGKKYICNSSYDNGPGQPKGRLVVPLTTENLLLNAFRALAFGMSYVIHIDVEYSTNFEGYGTMLVGVAGLDQKFHVVGYALVNKEDAKGHELVLEMIKAGVEAAVWKYREGLI